MWAKFKQWCLDETCKLTMHKWRLLTAEEIRVEIAAHRQSKYRRVSFACCMRCGRTDAQINRRAT